MSDQETKAMTNTELQLLGLKTLANTHTKALHDIKRAALELTGESDEFGHTSDWIYDLSDDRTPARILEITMAENERGEG